MRIAYKDRAFLHQSSAIPNLPSAEDAVMIFAEDHVTPNVSGSEMYRVPLLQALVDAGHTISFLERRSIMPSDEMDYELARLVDYFPEFAPFVLDSDPLLGIKVVDNRGQINEDVVTEYYPIRDGDSGMTSTEWYLKQFADKRWTEPPKADICVMQPLRTNIASGFDQSYIVGCYLERGTPVVLWDCDRNLSGTVALIKHMGWSWPHPLLTLMSPYVVPTSWGPTELIDFPYRPWQVQEPLPVSEKDGIAYIGNDYDRRDKMERLVVGLDRGEIPVTVYGKFENNRKDKDQLSGYKGDVEEWTTGFPHVNWAGRIPNNQVPAATNRGLLTVNVVRKDYVKLGLITLRTIESPMYGTLQVADGDIVRIEEFVPGPYLVKSSADVRRIYARVRKMDDSEYGEELECQRKMLRDRLDFDGYFVPRFMEILEDAVDRAKCFRSDHGDLKDAASKIEYMQPARRK